MWKICATHPRRNPWFASHSLSAVIERAAAAFTTSSREGRAVAMPPMGTASCFRQIATSRLKMVARKSVVLMSTPNRSGHT